MRSRFDRGNVIGGPEGRAAGPAISQPSAGMGMAGPVEPRLWHEAVVLNAWWVLLQAVLLGEV